MIDRDFWVGVALPAGWSGHRLYVRDVVELHGPHGERFEITRPELEEAGDDAEGVLAFVKRRIAQEIENRSALMTGDEALAEVLDLLARTVIKVPQQAPGPLVLGQENAATLIRMLNTAGWSWVRHERAQEAKTAI